MSDMPADRNHVDSKGVFRCPIQVPDPSTAKTPKQRDGLVNAARLKIFIEGGLLRGDLPIHNGHLNCKAIAKILGFGRSGYSSNSYMSDIVAWGESRLGCEASRYVPKNDQKEGDPEKEVQRLKGHVDQVLASLAEANDRLREYRYLEQGLLGGRARLPW